MSEKFQYFNELKFTRDEKTGYYLNSTNRIRLHRYVWQYYNGSIPKGMVVHHKDEDKSNNDITNLELQTLSQHSRLHANDRVKKNYAEIITNLKEKALPKAIEWHKSELAKEFHRKLAEISINVIEKKEYICQNCGRLYITRKKSTNKFCSNKCKSSWRRKNGIDNEERRCVYCGKNFITNKYSKAQVCGVSCSNRLRANRNKINNSNRI